MAVPAPSNSLDIGDAFGYVFRSPDWFAKILVGSVCVLFGWLLIPFLILLGYEVAAARAVSEGRSELPPWDTIGQKLGDGFLLVVSLIVWTIPVDFFFILGSALGGCSSSAGGTSTCSNSGALTLFFALGCLAVVVLVIVAPAIWAQFVEGGIGASLQFGTVVRRGFSNLGNSIVVVIMAIVVSILGSLGFILLFVGALVTLPWAYYVQANLYGQFARLTRGTGLPATS